MHDSSDNQMIPYFLELMKGRDGTYGSTIYEWIEKYDESLTLIEVINKLTHYSLVSYDTQLQCYSFQNTYCVN